MEIKTSVVRVTVSWDVKIPCFKYLLEPIACADIHNAGLHGFIEDSFESLSFYFATHDELLKIGRAEAKQKRSNMSIMVESKDVIVIYKFPLWPANRLHCLRKLPKPEQVLSSNWLKYKKVRFDPLKPPEAKDCICDFTEKLATVISNLHKKNNAHQDLRLPNVRFDDDYNPILIDLDTLCYANEYPDCTSDISMFNGRLRC